MAASAHGAVTFVAKCRLFSTSTALWEVRVVQYRYFLNHSSQCFPSLLSFYLLSSSPCCSVDLTSVSKFLPSLLLFLLMLFCCYWSGSSRAPDPPPSPSAHTHTHTQSPPSPPHENFPIFIWYQYVLATYMHILIKTIPKELTLQKCVFDVCVCAFSVISVMCCS